MSLAIRKPNPSEEDLFVELSCSLTEFNLENGPELHDEEDVMQAREERARRLFRDTNPKRVILFAEFEQAIVGYVLGHIYEPNLATETLDPIVGNVDELYVDQNVRAQGIGKSLLDAISAWMKSHKASTMTLRMYAWNEPAKGFYKNEGFELYDMSWQKNL